MSYEITGKVIKVGEIRPAGKSQVRQVVIETDDGKYTQQVPLDIWGGAADKADSINVGAQIAVTFDIRGRDYNGKYYCSLSAWRWVIEDAGPGVVESQDAFIDTAEDGAMPF